MTERSNESDKRRIALDRITDPALAAVAQKFFARERLDEADGLVCLETRDLLGLGQLAYAARIARFGKRAFYVVNHHLNYTNICANACKFCAFHRTADSTDGYLLSPGEAASRISASAPMELKEVHLVGAINPEPDFSYFVDLLAAVKKAAPRAELKAFTAVEIDHIARRAGLSWEECLTTLRAAGLSALPGGGAEVFSERVRQMLFPSKISAETWLAVHATAHRLGIGTNATLLFGHLETPTETIKHFARLRAQQDQTRGFRAFIPLVFHPRNTEMAHLPGPTGVEILKVIATARLMLDNIPHIKAYWIMLGLKLAQTALHFGADDLEGTIVHEKITHEAGATTSVGLSRKDLEELIVDAGFQPVERDTFHQTVAAL
ncbi:MAG: aminofutalosine synthase MqnE [Desulfomonile tiedjei]|nr:aminofutalosine synthase MqnE [Desulfomonile tiedjei]